MGRMKGAKKKGQAVTRTKKSQQAQQEDEYTKTPHSFVIHRGDVGKSVRQLVHDMRNVMSPFTATNLKPRRKNVLKDYIAIAGPLNVTHLMSFSRSELSLNLRVMRLPKGPTLTFNILEYSLCRDVISSLKKHNMDPKQFKHHPLLVMNGIAGEGRHFPLMATMFQNMFLPINVNQVKLSSIKRCVLMNYDKEDDTIEFRHFNIRTVPVGMSRGVKKLLKAKVPNMANYDDISEYVMRGGNLSESEGEMDGPHNEVTLPQQLPGRGNMKNAQSAIRLTEIGPRLKLRLVKIENEICSGPVLYHKFIERTKQELATVDKKRSERKNQKEARKRQQQQNVEAKTQLKEEMKQKSLAGMKIKAADEPQVEVEEDDDVEYYKSEVGVEPEAELLLKRTKRKYEDGDTQRTFKKPKSDYEGRGGFRGRGGSSDRGGFRGRGGSSDRGGFRGRGGSSDRGGFRGRGDSRGGSRGRGGSSDRGGFRGRGDSRGGSYDGFISIGGSRGESRGRGGSRGGSRGRGGSFDGSRGRGGSRGGTRVSGGSFDRSRGRGGSRGRSRGRGASGGRGLSRGGSRGRGSSGSRLSFDRNDSRGGRGGRGGSGRGRPGGRDFKRKR